MRGNIVDTLRSTEPAAIEFEYQLSAPTTGLRVGFYLSTMRGDYVLTSFDTDEPEKFEKFSARKAGRYVSRCTIPADLFNEGRYSLGVNASSFAVRRYFSTRMPWLSTWMSPARPERIGLKRALDRSAHALIGRSKRWIDGHKIRASFRAWRIAFRCRT